jgi:DNA-binding PadR family transcriptional regulator
MNPENRINRYLPLSEATCYIMLTLVKPLHGYGVMQMVEKLSEGTVAVGPGTLYGVLTSLEKEKLIVKVREEDRRKVYVLTQVGREVLQAQVERLAVMTREGRKAIQQMEHSID